MTPKSYKDLVFDIVGAAIDVHSELRWGLAEPIYNEALHLELLSRGIPNEREVNIPCFYRGIQLEKRYQMDIVVGDVIIELKSAERIISAHRMQLFNYLRLTKKPIGLLINLGCKRLQGERYAYFDDINECVLLDKEMNTVFFNRKNIYAD